MAICRRKFIKNVGATVMLIPLATSPWSFFSIEELNEPLEVHLFSKHLHFINVKEAAQISKELGFSGLDLTERPKGHVLPENVETNLPKAIPDIKVVGSSCERITLPLMT
ncbi:hypothetical protein [Ulvibacterium marinum]|uniref:Sugar phosphate isomerase/epimerase n=1 Tax=Ulvibacterium marinum TaxID=2419782 RepID=A0A3B0C2B8_9FLAO|nr:hypothetical protein [Ulvibacterium marinum]RKN77847.1 hypothetical protein D7Z94_21660 [Ulvibacterium marinum]